MASRTTICSPAEVLAVLGKASSATNDDRGMVEMLLPLVDGSIKSFLGYEVIYNTYTHLLPDTDMYDPNQFGDAWPLGEPFDAKSGRISYFYPGTPNILQVPEIPLRSVVSLLVDFSSAGGQSANDFGSATALVLGTDYYVQYDAPDIGQTIPYQSGVCWAGHIRRWLGGVWPNRAQTALCIYKAGITPDELDGKTAFPSRRVADIKLAAMQSMVAAFRQFKAWADRSGGQEAGPIIAERLADYSATYAESAVLQATGLMAGLPFSAQQLLRPFMKYRV